LKTDERFKNFIFVEVARYRDFIIAESSKEYFVFLRFQWNSYKTDKYLFKHTEYKSIMNYIDQYY
jgi:hypothetical protein